MTKVACKNRVAAKYIRPVMANFSIRVFAVAIAIGLAVASCGKDKDKPDDEGSNSDDLFDIKTEQITTNLDNKTAVLAEIPKEMFKGVGKVNTAYVWANTVSDRFKYIVVFSFDVKSGEKAAKTLVDYYRSAGATVEETGNKYNPYSVVFDWGESTEITFGSFEGQDHVNVQFSVVKE
jgi:hypothetical protein